MCIKDKKIMIHISPQKEYNLYSTRCMSTETQLKNTHERKVRKEKRDEVATFLDKLENKNALLQHIYTELNNNLEIHLPEHTMMLNEFKFITKRTCDLLKHEFNTFTKLRDLGYFYYVNINIVEAVDILLDYTIKSFLIYAYDPQKKTKDDLNTFSEILSLQVIYIATIFGDHKCNYTTYTQQSTIELQNVSQKQLFFTIYIRYLRFFIKNLLSRKKETLTSITYSMAYKIHDKTNIWIFDDQMESLSNFQGINFNDEDYLLMTADKK
jgi:hypothetical protein